MDAPEEQRFLINQLTSRSLLLQAIGTVRNYGYFKSSAFNTCPHQPLQMMTGKPQYIRFTQGAKPSAVHTPIPVPHHWKKRVKQDLDREVALGIIEPVPTGTPTVWCSRMVVAPKKDGSPRRIVNLQKLNAATRRETHHTPSPFNQVLQTLG